MARLALAFTLMLASNAHAQSPVFPPIDTIVAICIQTSNKPACDTTRATFATDWEKAQKGDYPAQRNIAYCLTTGCDGATIVDSIEACAWRMIIQATPVRKEPTETTSYDQACKPLTNRQRKEALSRAEAMYVAIYGQQLPLEKLFRD